MTRKRRYVALYERDTDSDVWLVRVDGIDGCHTYGRTLRRAGDRIREALALWLDRDPDGLTIVDEWPSDLVDVATKVSEARHTASVAAQQAAAATAQEAQRLDRMGLSRRDAADVLGISHQRVQQLLA